MQNRSDSSLSFMMCKYSSFTAILIIHLLRYELATIVKFVKLRQDPTYEESDDSKMATHIYLEHHESPSPVRIAVCPDLHKV